MSKWRQPPCVHWAIAPAWLDQSPVGGGIDELELLLVLSSDAAGEGIRTLDPNLGKVKVYQFEAITLG
jgi:hypothetical protein